MKISFHILQTQKVEWTSLAVKEFSEKISHNVNFELHSHKSKNFSRSEKDKKIKKEEEIILKHIKPNDFLILFDENGQTFKDSIEFSKKLIHLFETKSSHLNFLIGGAYGVSEEIKKRANLKIKLSNFTMNHHVAQVIALEQIYRGLMIYKNKPYHNV